MKTKKGVKSLIFLGVCIILNSTNSLAGQWWQKNIEQYSYNKNTHGLKHTGTKIYFNCSLIDDSRHRILVDDDWDKKVKALGYRTGTIFYNVISVSGLKVVDPSVPKGWYDAVCYGEIMIE